MAAAERVVADRGQAEGGPSPIAGVAAGPDRGGGSAGSGGEPAQGGQLPGGDGPSCDGGGGAGGGRLAPGPAERRAGTPMDPGAVGVRGAQDRGVLVPDPVRCLRRARRGAPAGGGGTAAGARGG